MKSDKKNMPRRKNRTTSRGGGIPVKQYEFLNKHIVYEYLNAHTNLSLNPLVIGYERCKSTKTAIGPLTRNRYIMQYVFEGRGTLKVANRTYNIGKNTLMFLPIEEIAYAPDPEDPWAYLWIEFTGQHAGALLESAGLTARSPIFVPDDPDEMFSLFAEMIDGIHRTENRDFYYLFCTANLMKILHVILCRRNSAEIKRGNDENRLQPVLDYLDKHFADPDLTVKRICEIFYWSPSYLSRVFKKVVHISPIKYINQLRIRKAQRMLDGKQFNISTIAYACGYQSPYYFSLEFKRYVGVAPSRYVPQSTE